MFSKKKEKELADLQRDSWLIEANHRNVHTMRTFYEKDFERLIFLASDLHWDNPQSKWDLIKRDFDEAVDNKAKIIINGDLFCLMQGKWDPRASKDKVRPEHRTNHYLDSIVSTAVEWFAPYAEHIAVIGRGNHEQSIQRRHETDILQRFVDMMNLVHKPQQAIQLGGYGGWIRFMFDREKSHDPKTIKMKYYHGSGGGGPVTKGMIGNTRRQTAIHGADMIWTGHVHEDVTAVYMSEYLNASGNIELRETDHIITATYKEEYNDNYGGWHNERGAPPKPLGGRWLKFYNESREIKFTHYRKK